MKQIPLQYIASYYGHCEKFMEGYKQGLTGYLLDFAIKRYASHRPFPTNLTKNLRPRFRYSEAFGGCAPCTRRKKRK